MGCFVIDDDRGPLISQFMIGDETNSSNIFNFRLFILERITNLKPGEEQEDPERSLWSDNLERMVDENMKIEERTFIPVKANQASTQIYDMVFLRMSLAQGINQML
ncbi:hypothetical protein HID58_086170 [Brassica napus]|uniref:Uncharacterized protein n=1 Tax=Brassica napus TaxID=3708 RepID=A0ABQ7XR13_BRANA|nr:hypothetical protein HID58_086170 [Brassica napus]